MSNPEPATVSSTTTEHRSGMDTPYSNQATVYALGEEKYTAFEVKELLIELSIRAWPSDVMSTDLTAIDFSLAASFDPKDLEAVKSGAPLYTGPDLFTVLEHDARASKRSQYLLQIITSRTNKILQDEVHKLLDEELGRTGRVHLTGDQSSWVLKVRAVAADRIKSAVSSRFTESLSAKERGSSFEYRVSLRSLRGGYPGHPVITTLVFDLATSFDFFLSQLQDATQLSVIPPLGVNEPYRTSRPMIHPDKTDGCGEDIIEYQQNALGIMIPTPPASFSTTPRTTDADHLRRKSCDPGYTLADGPWLYRVYSDFRTRSGYTDSEGIVVLNREITDVRSYKDMLEHIKAALKKSGARGETLVVGITHSMDNAAIEKWKHHVEEEACEEKRFRQDLVVNNGYQEANTGEPYIDYMSRTMAEVRREETRKREMLELKIAVQKSHQPEIDEQKAVYDNGGNWSPRFGQTAYNSWLRDKESEIELEVDKQMGLIDENKKVKEKLDNPWN